MSGEFWNGDCLELMKNIPDGTVDMILCDLPYGTTQNKWDAVIPFEPLWEQYWRVAKPNAVVVLTAAQPFSSALVMSQVEHFKYDWVWNKTRPSGHLNAKKMPMRAHESVLVFGKSNNTYNPIMETGAVNHVNTKPKKIKHSENYGAQETLVVEKITTDKYPRSVQTFKNVSPTHIIHPTQKPVALFEYLIKTYTNEGETVLDNTAGSGTTAIAAINTNRNWICIEKDEEYYSKACARIAAHKEALETPKLEID